MYTKYSSYPSRGLTPQRLAEIFREADEGEVYRQMELFEEMEEHDPHLYSQLQTRKNAVTGLDWEVLPASDDPRNKEIAEFVEQQLKGIKNMEDVFLELLDAIGKGIAASEILWGHDAGGHVVVKGIEPVPGKLLRWDQEDVMRLIIQDDTQGIPLPPNKFIVHKYKAKSGHPSRAGILRVCAWMYLFKNYTLKDWVSFIEVFGLPLRLGKYATGASEDDKEALMTALVRIGTDAAGMVPDGTSIEFISTDGGKGASNGIYETMARYCDEQISKAILGQTLTSDSGGGSYAQSKTHNDVRHDLTLADCKALAATLQDDLIRPLVLFNFGETDSLPRLVFDCELPEDLKALVEILKSLVADMGVPVPLTYIYKKFGIPAPEKGEAVAKAPSYGSPLPLPLKLQTNKAGQPDEALQKAIEYQQRVDQITDTAMEKGWPLFEQMYAPLQKLLEEAGSLEDLEQLLANPEKMEELLGESESEGFQELLTNAMLLADLTGRMKEHE